MIESIRKWLIMVLGVALLFCGIVGLAECDKHTVPPANAKIDTIMQVRHDTIVHIDSVLKYKVKIVHDLAPDETDSLFDSIIPNDTIYLPSDTVMHEITVYQEKKCIEAKDSLIAYKQIVHIDSIAIDSVSRIGKEKAPSILDRAKDFGAGLLIGIGLRSLY